MNYLGFKKNTEIPLSTMWYLLLLDSNIIHLFNKYIIIIIIVICNIIGVGDIVSF